MRPLLRRLVFAAVICAAVLTVVAQAQPPAATTANPVMAGSKMMFGIVRNYIVRSAEKVDEPIFAFQPTPEVRRFGQLVGHIAEENYLICSAAIGEKPPVTDIEKTRSSKADLVKALTDSFAYCEKAYEGMTDAKGAEVVPFFGQKLARVSILDFNVAHDYEHYGNMVTYMRLKGIVPASSEKQAK